MVKLYFIETLYKFEIEFFNDLIENKLCITNYYLTLQVQNI